MSFQPGDKIIRWARPTVICPLESTGVVVRLEETSFGTAIWVSWDHLKWPDKENWYMLSDAEDMFVIDSNKPRPGNKIIVLDSPNTNPQDRPSYLDLD